MSGKHFLPSGKKNSPRAMENFRMGATEMPQNHQRPSGDERGGYQLTFPGQRDPLVFCAGNKFGSPTIDCL
jgi:hypothetical protein